MLKLSFLYCFDCFHQWSLYFHSLSSLSLLSIIPSIYLSIYLSLSLSLYLSLFFSSITNFPPFSHCLSSTYIYPVHKLVSIFSFSSIILASILICHLLDCCMSFFSYAQIILAVLFCLFPTVIPLFSFSCAFSLSLSLSLSVSYLSI